MKNLKIFGIREGILVILTLFSMAHGAMPSVHELTLEEKIGQMLIVHFYGSEVNQEAQNLISKTHVGGFIYYNWSNGLVSPDQVRNLSQDLQELASIPLFISVDQEGGRVARLTARGFTHFPANSLLGLIDNPKLTFFCAKTTGEELKSVGVNMNYAPVADIDSSGPIGDRSYGSSPQLVARHVLSAVRGYKAAGIIPVIKHFPGHGSAAVDSHIDLPVINKTEQELVEHDLIPFLESLEESPAVMIGHLLIPSIDQECATLSSTIIEGLLRKKLGYQGLVITDSLVMEGVLKHSETIENAALKAIQAGNDLLIFGGRKLAGNDVGLSFKVIEAIHRRLVQAVEANEISMQKVDESVERILKLKLENFANS